MKAKSKSSIKIIPANDHIAITRIPMVEIWEKFSLHPDWQEMLAAINEKKFTAKDSGVSYRLINHWTEEGLLADERGKDSKDWRKLSLKDILWLRILRQLRDFGLSIEKLRKSYDLICLVDSQEESFFDLVIMLCLHEPPVPMFVVVYEDGELNFATLPDLKLLDESTGYQFSYIRINLNWICCEILGANADLPKILPAHYLDRGEESVISALREVKHNEITVRKENGTISRIDTIKKVEGAQEIADLIREVGFGEITLKIAEGKQVHTALTKKTKLKT